VAADKKPGTNTGGTGAPETNYLSRDLIIMIPNPNPIVILPPHRQTKTSRSRLRN